MIQHAQVIDEEGGLTETVQELPGSPVIKKGSCRVLRSLMNWSKSWDIDQRAL